MVNLNKLNAHSTVVYGRSTKSIKSHQICVISYFSSHYTINLDSIIYTSPLQFSPITITVTFNCKSLCERKEEQEKIMKLSSVIASTVLAASTQAYVTTGSRVQKRQVTDKLSTITMTHSSPIVVQGGGLNDPDVVYDLEVNTRIVGGIFITEIPAVTDMEEPNPETGTGGIAVRYYRRIFAGESTLGTVSVGPEQGLEANTEVEVPGSGVDDASFSCYLLTKTDSSEFESPDGGLPSNVRYIESEDALFFKSEPFGLSTPFDASVPYDGIECE